LEEGVKLIQHMIHGVAFAQIKTRYEKVIEKLRESDNKKSTLFKPLIASLVQLSTKLNYENVMKILELLNNIRAATLEQQNADRLAEETAQHDWEVLLAQLEYQKKTLSDKRQRLQNLIEATTALLKQLKESLENHKVELENLQISLQQQTAWCETESNTYITQTTERNREIDILTKLLNHIKEKY
jgi:chromosome segregation ATPase